MLAIVEPAVCTACKRTFNARFATCPFCAAPRTGFGGATPGAALRGEDAGAPPVFELPRALALDDDELPGWPPRAFWIACAVLLTASAIVWLKVPQGETPKHAGWGGGRLIRFGFHYFFPAMLGFVLLHFTWRSAARAAWRTWGGPLSVSTFRPSGDYMRRVPYLWPWVVASVVCGSALHAGTSLIGASMRTAATRRSEADVLAEWAATQRLGKLPEGFERRSYLTPPGALGPTEFLVDGAGRTLTRTSVIGAHASDPLRHLAALALAARPERCDEDASVATCVQGSVVAACKREPSLVVCVSTTIRSDESDARALLGRAWP